ncbi:MAG: exosortase-associated EpsI family protein [Planctomycetota bacterium]
MSRLVPILIAVIAIGALTFVEGRLSDRWGDNRHGAYCASLMDDTPKQIGAWVGTDNEVTDEEREGSGAKGYVSRTYVNSAAGKQVGVWFIVGHARDTYRHTPDICYGGSGFKMDDTQRRYQMTLENGTPASFWTAVFTRDGIGGSQKQRVFWAWFRPEPGSGDPVTWSVPDGKSDLAIRREYSAAPALYKIYFTTSGSAAEAEGDESVCMEFAREFFAAVNPILAPANETIPEGFTPPAETEGA